MTNPAVVSDGVIPSGIGGSKVPAGAIGARSPAGVVRAPDELVVLAHLDAHREAVGPPHLDLPAGGGGGGGGADVSGEGPGAGVAGGGARRPAIGVGSQQDPGLLQIGDHRGGGRRRVRSTGSEPGVDGGFHDRCSAALVGACADRPDDARGGVVGREIDLIGPAHRPRAAAVEGQGVGGGAVAAGHLHLGRHRQHVVAAEGGGEGVGQLLGGHRAVGRGVAGAEAHGGGDHRGQGARASEHRHRACASCGVVVPARPGRP